MTTSTITRSDHTRRNQKPAAPMKAQEIQAFGHSRKQPIALSESACNASIDDLNQLLADTITLRDLYKKHHWQVSGPTFYQLHLLFDKHAGEQTELIDQIAERIQTLGGIAIAMGGDVAQATLIPPAPKGRETPAAQIARLLNAHEIILEECRAMAKEATKNGDDGTNDLIVSDLIRTNETQVWFISQHIAETTA
jgi:starvation-inducible DNA-binding protein